MTSYLNRIGWNFHQISKWLYFTAMVVLVKIKNYCWCRHCKLKKQEFFCFFRKSNLCVCRNLPQRFHRTAQNGFGTKMLPTWFWWSNLSKENLFWLFRRGSLKTQKIVKNCYFSNMKNGVSFSIFPNEFSKTNKIFLNLELTASKYKL